MTDVSQFPADRTASGRRWGKAGVRLTDGEIEAARRACVAEAMTARIEQQMRDGKAP